MSDGNRKKIIARNALVSGSKGTPVSTLSDDPVLAQGSAITERIEELPRDVGWMLFGVGFAGFVAPGIFGLPFMVAGGMILWPKTTKRLQNLLVRPSATKTEVAGMKQIVRFLDDLERRYPGGNQS